MLHRAITRHIRVTVSQRNYTCRRITPSGIQLHSKRVGQTKSAAFLQPSDCFRREFSSAVDIIPLAMPSLSPTMTHGTISSWKAAPGDELKAGDLLCEIETDKASVGFEMQEDSILAKILVDAHGPELPCGAPIALTVEDADAYTAFLQTDPASYQHLLGGLETGPAVESTTSDTGVSASTGVSIGANSEVNLPAGDKKFSPAARHMAESQALNTNAVHGTSKGGLISKQDLILAVKAGIATVDPAKKEAQALKLVETSSATLPKPAATASPSIVTPAAAPASVEISQLPVNDRYEDIPNSNMRKVISKRLTESKATVPHFYTSIECEIDSLMSMRKQLKNEFQVNVSVNDLVIKSAALALRDVPEANSKWNKGTSSIDASHSGEVDISIAVATPSGLITPILTSADKRGLSDINATVRDLATRARDGKLKPEEYQGGSFSISNLGMFGITSFSAVINPPQACILAVGAGIKKVVPPRAQDVKLALELDKKLEPRVVTTVTVQLSGDRRVVDEGTASQFLQVFQSYLSNPKTMVL